MATYKVIQDIEAEDKFVGPLTLRQFIYIAIFIVSGYISFLFIQKHVWFLMLPLLPIMLLSGFLGFPWGRDQPTEVWLLAKIRFFFKPRRRIWDQTGIQELVTITAPKKVEEHLTNELSQTEVRSRLQALANTIDSRGWIVKDVNVNMYAHPQVSLAALGASDDRLVGASTLPQQAPIVDIQAADDIMDEASNPTAQKLDQMIVSSAEARRKELLENMDRARQAEPQAKQTQGSTQPRPDYWFMEQADTAKTMPGYATFSAQTVDPGVGAVTTPTELSAEDKALLEKVHKEKQQEENKPPVYGKLRVVQPLSHGRKNKPANSRQTSEAGKPKAQEPPKPKPQAPSVTQAPDPDILKLAINNDRNVASLAREATANRKKEDPPDEVVISLH